MTKRSKDYDVRAAVVAALLERGVPRRDIRHEITLDTSSAGGRADVVVLRDRLITIEIKSGSDKLDRLKTQVNRYKRSFDFVKVVADRRHAEAIFNGYSVYGTVYWCGETQQFVGGWYDNLKPCEPMLITSHYGTYSSETSVVDVARLLWRNEAVRVSLLLGGPGGTREAAISWMRENARLADVRPLAIKELRNRLPNRWEDAFWKRFDKSQAEAAAS